MTNGQQRDPYFKDPFEAWLIEDERKTTDAALQLWRRQPTRASLMQLSEALKAEAQQLDAIELDRAHRFSVGVELDPKVWDEHNGIFK